MRKADDELRAKLQQHLGRKLASVPRRCQMAATGIPTLQDFSQLLPEMTLLMLKRFRKEATAHPPAGPVIARPRLRRADRMDQIVFDWLRATVMVRPREFLICPLSSPYLTNMNVCPAGISVGEEINFTFDISPTLTG